MKKNRKNKYLLKENGGVSVLVLFTVFTFMVILMGAFITVTTLRKSQLKSDMQIQEIYGRDAEKVDEVYEDLNKKYIISYNSNTQDTITNMPSNKKIDISEEILIDEKIPEYENHIFLGWGINSDDTSPTYQPGDVYNGKEGIELYAIWITKLEYLQGTGTQYVDTGIKFNSDMKLETKMYIPGNTTTAYCSFGVRTINNNNVIQAFYECGKQIVVADDSEYVIYNTTDGEILYTFSSNSLTYNGTTVTTKYCTNTQYNLYLFTINSNGEPLDGLGGIKLYYSKIWDNNNKLVQELIPCLDKANTPCLYDNITKKFFYNQGSGTFLYGELQ